MRCPEWLITSTSCATDPAQDSLVKEILEYLNKQTDNGSHWRGPSSAAEMSRFIVNYCVGTYDRKRKGGGLLKEERSIRQIFSDYMNQIVRSNRTDSSRPKG